MVNAKPAKEVKKGDTLVWNYGITSVVEAVVKETPKQIVISERYDSGKSYTRRMVKERLVGVML